MTDGGPHLGRVGRGRSRDGQAGELTGGLGLGIGDGLPGHVVGQPQGTHDESKESDQEKAAHCALTNASKGFASPEDAFERISPSAASSFRPLIVLLPLTARSAYPLSHLSRPISPIGLIDRSASALETPDPEVLS